MSASNRWWRDYDAECRAWEREITQAQARLVLDDNGELNAIIRFYSEPEPRWIAILPISPEVLAEMDRLRDEAMRALVGDGLTPPSRGSSSR